MKSLLRYYLINLVALWFTTETIKGFSFSGGMQDLAMGALAFTAINFLLVPLIRILLLPLNLLTLGVFSWVTNVLALFALTNFLPNFKIMPYSFPGYSYSGFNIPAADLSTLWVAIVASLMIGILTHLLHWLVN